MSDGDFGHPISLSRSCDQIISEDAAHAMAEEFGETQIAYVYRLEAVYRPAQSREIPEYLVDAAAARSLPEYELGPLVQRGYILEDNHFGGTD